MLAADGTVRALAASDGRSFEVREGPLLGEVGLRFVSFAGWAADPRGGRPSDGVVLFHDDRFITRVAARGYTPGVATRLGNPDLTKTGFEFLIPFTLLGSPDFSRLRFFALLDDGAALLPYHDIGRALPWWVLAQPVEADGDKPP